MHCLLILHVALERRHKGSKVSAFSLHPGTISTTSIVRNVAKPGTCFGRVAEFLLSWIPNIGELKSVPQARLLYELL